MRQKSVKNFKLMLGDIAVDNIFKDNTHYIIVVSLADESLRTLLTYNSLDIVSSNMQPEQITYVLDKVAKNKELLDA